MPQKNWDKHEVALLIEAYQNIKQGRVDRNTALVALSQNLRKMAQNQGVIIDDTYRNLNGMRWQLGIIEGVFFQKDYDKCTPPKIFIEMVEIFKNSQQQFHSVLKEAYIMVDNSTHKNLSINDILGNTYEDFALFCNTSGKIYPDELSAIDYVAFRSQCGVSRQYVDEIKNKLAASSNKNRNADAVAPATQTLDIIGGTEKAVLNINGESKNIEERIAGIDVVDTDCELSYGLDRKASLPFNIHSPLYQVLQVDAPDKYAEIGIEVMGFNNRVNNILMSDSRTTVEDLLRCSVVQVFDLHTIARSAISKIISKIKAFVDVDIDSLDGKLRQTSIPLMKIINIKHPEKYKGIDVYDVDFSVRFFNVLHRNKITDLYSVLCLSIDDLRKLEGLGDGSIVDAVKRIHAFVNNPNQSISVAHAKSPLNIAEKINVKAAVDAMLSGAKIEELCLTFKEQTAVCNYLQAIETVGEELYYAVLSNPNAFMSVSGSMVDFFVELADLQQKRNLLNSQFSEIKPWLFDKHVKLLVSTYYLRNKDAMQSFWETIPEECLLSDVFTYIPDDVIKINANELERFFTWVRRLDLSEISGQVFSQTAMMKQYKTNDNLKDKYLFALELRASGKTLEDIGMELNTTRERIRQIEKRGTNAFADYYRNNQYDLLALIHTLRCGDKVLRFSEVENYIGTKYTQLLWLVLSKELLDNVLYRYSKDYDAVMFFSSGDNIEEKITLAFNDAPSYFFADQYELVMSDIAQKHAIDRELIQIDMEKIYRLYGTIYSKEPITVAFMCSYVLKNKFQQGFKIGVQEESDIFRKYLFEIFGAKGEMTNRAIEAKIGQIGVLCDRGKYIHSDFVNIDKSVIDMVNEYIENSEKTVLTYSEIFDGMNHIFAGTQITNRFILQGVLRLYNCKFIMAKDYISKEAGKSLADEFENFARMRGEFSKTDFFVEFPAMTDANLAMLLARCKNIFGIDSCMYMHADMLNITDADYSEIRKYLNVVCVDIPIDARYLYNEFVGKFVDFMTKNEINGYNKLFGILSFMFAGEFVFSRPYISKNNSDELNKKAIILRRLEGYDRIAIDEVVDICNENNLRFGSVPFLIKMISPEFIRVDAKMLMRYELTGLTDDIVTDVMRYVLAKVESYRFYSVLLFDDFLFLPTISVEWNSFLLESIADLDSKTVPVIKIPMKSYTTLTSIFVGDEYIEEDYQTFILQVVDDAYQKSFFSTKAELREWLSDMGLITNNSLPNFLESGSYYYMNDNGFLMKRGQANV